MIKYRSSQFVILTYSTEYILIKLGTIKYRYTWKYVLTHQIVGNIKNIILHLTYITADIINSRLDFNAAYVNLIYPGNFLILKFVPSRFN